MDKRFEQIISPKKIDECKVASIQMETQIKTTMRYCYTPTRMAKI